MGGKTIALAFAVVGAMGCSSGAGGSPLVGVAGMGGGFTGAAGSTAGQNVLTFRQAINRNIDVVFMVDNSSSMTGLQAQLIQAFPSYTAILKSLPGGLPNLHLGVVSSSMGAGRNGSIAGCATGGDQGIFQSAPQGCAASGLLPGQNFIINVNGMANYTGDLETVFSCIAALGDQGCGFEHQFESVLRALGADGAAAPAQNANFLRTDAFLQIVLLTDEDDCSAPPDSDLFDMSSMTISDPLGPLQSYRCNEFGHLCGGKPPPRQPKGETDLGTCVSAEDGRLLRVQDVVTAMKRLKPDPTKVLVAAIAGPPKPYKVNVGPSQVKTDPSMWPFVEASCKSSTSGVQGDPAVRINQWVDAFGANGVFEEDCADSFAPALQAIAEQIGKVLAPPCLGANVDASKCKFVDHQTNASGAVVSTPLSECTDTADPGPCWSTQSNTPACPGAQSVLFQRPGGPVTTDLTTTATCPM